MRLKNDRKGSLTVEAAIILPLFLCFSFFMVFVIKTACIHVSLDHAVRETAKEIAATAYPLSFMNEMLDELENKNDGLTADFAGELLGELMTGTIDEHGLQKILLELSGKEFAEHIGYDWKKQAQKEIARALLQKNLIGTNVNAEELYLTLVEFPQSDWEFKKNRTNSEEKNSEYSEQGNNQTGLLPEQDFGQNDAVIELEYKLAIPLAFFKDWQITFRHAAVERAWLTGGNGVYSDRQDIGIYEQKTDEEIVYVTRTGIKYHADGCRYLKKSKIPIPLEEARRTYGACKICRPKG